MVSYKNVYEGRLPYALWQADVEDSSRNSYEFDCSYLKNLLLDVTLSSRVVFKKKGWFKLCLKNGFRMK